MSDERAGRVDTSGPSIARVYDALLGGKDHFQVDRDLCTQLVRTSPELPETARENLRFLSRVVRWLVGERGIDQILDLGSGLPTTENVHEVAQRIVPDTTVVYVDDDPAVGAYGRVLLEDGEHTHFCAADFTDPTVLLGAPTVTRHLDMDRPVAVLHCLTLHHLSDLRALRRIMASYEVALAPGSYVVLTHASLPAEDSEQARQLYATASTYRGASSGFTLRTPEEIRSLLPGLEILDPGLVPVTAWWPDGPRPGSTGYLTRHLLGAVARKP